MRVCQSTRVDDAIRRVLGLDARIAYAYRFGSTATWRSTWHSDVDVAIGLRDGASMDHRGIGELVSQPGLQAGGTAVRQGRAGASDPWSMTPFARRRPRETRRSRRLPIHE
jgi:hypothetical protein